MFDIFWNNINSLIFVFSFYETDSKLVQLESKMNDKLDPGCELSKYWNMLIAFH